MHKLPFLVALAACGGEDLVDPPTPDPADVASVEVGAERTRLTVGDTLRLVAVPRDGDGQPLDGVTVAWSSADTAVATVDAGGLVAARAPGTTRVSATTGERSGSVDLEVVAADDGEGGDGGNLPPVARANGPYEGVTGQPIAVRRDGSGDPDDAWTVDWSFGDGTVAGPLDGASAPDPTHAYVEAGIYELVLTVRNARGLAAAETTYAVVGHAPGALPRYLSLGTLGGDISYALAVNGADMVVGYSHVGPSASGAPEHAFLWTSATGMRDLGTLPGGRHSSATDVNDRGGVVGVADDAGGAWQAVRWTRDGIEALGPARADGRVAVNDSGHVAWVAGDASATTRLFADGAVTDIGAPAEAQPWDHVDLNDAGQVVRGRSVWTAATGWRPLPDPPGTLGSVAAVGLNDAGDVVGGDWFQFDGYTGSRGVRWLASGAVEDFGEEFMPNAVNALGAMAGYVGLNYREPNQPAYRAADGRILPLGDATGNYATGRAYDVNRLGRVAGAARNAYLDINPDLTIYAVLWSPE